MVMSRSRVHPALPLCETRLAPLSAEAGSVEIIPTVFVSLLWSSPLLTRSSPQSHSKYGWLWQTNSSACRTNHKCHICIYLYIYVYIYVYIERTADRVGCRMPLDISRFSVLPGFENIVIYSIESIWRKKSPYGIAGLAGLAELSELAELDRLAGLGASWIGLAGQLCRLARPIHRRKACKIPIHGSGEEQPKREKPQNKIPYIRAGCHPKTIQNTLKT